MQKRLAQAIANLDAWLETMRQPGGYGGPVVHWWQHRFQYTGPGHDWRYEGILSGYASLYAKTGDPGFLERLQVALQDIVQGQKIDGSYRASRFEINPGSLGTPHEAAASWGLLIAARYANDADLAVRAATKNLQNLIEVLWDGTGFNDRPGGAERVPNKLATLAAAFIELSAATGDDRWLAFARSCLDDVVASQVPSGRWAGAVHQISRAGDAHDGRFFPYYNARCVPPLLQGAEALSDPRYREAAERIAAFLQRVVEPDGSWPQIVYAGGRTTDLPRWVAGVADIFLAFDHVGQALPNRALSRLLDAQLPGGGFRTADGFSRERPSSSSPPDFRDVVPVVGWNDKVLRFLARRLDHGAQIPEASTYGAKEPVWIGREAGEYQEDAQSMRLLHPERLTTYRFDKCDPWAASCAPMVNIR